MRRMVHLAGSNSSNLKRRSADRFIFSTCSPGNMTSFPEEPGSWQKKDWLILAGFALISLLLLLIRLNHPNRLVFDEHWYARDGCWYVLSSRPQCDLNREILVDKNVPAFLSEYKEVSPEQPPLGKWLIGAGIWLFGMHFFSLRLAPVGC